MIEPFRTTFWPFLLAGICAVSPGEAQEPVASAKAAPLQEIVARSVTDTVAQFSGSGLKPDQLAVTLVDLRDRTKPVQTSYRGDVQVYPASVIKLFYLMAVHRWLEDGKIEDSEELRRALRDMIVDSGNEPTHYVVDLLTGTTSGPELPPGEMEEWKQKRNAVNRYFSSLGYTNINANQKPWCEGPYGRERVFVGRNYDNRNMLTTDATARLMTEIALGRAVSPERSEQMLKLMERDPFRESAERNQANDYIGAALKPGAKLWSKAGWTSTVRHDAACVELPDGNRFVLVIFTTGRSKDREIIPALAGRIIEGLTR